MKTTAYSAITRISCFIYGCIVGFFGYPMTQAQISKRYRIAKSTVNDNVKKLERFKFVLHIQKMGTNKLYTKGPNHALIESFFQTYFKNYSDLVCTHQCKIDDSNVVRKHLNGGWVSVNVIKEGKTDYYNITDDWKIKKLVDASEHLSKIPKNEIKTECRQTIFGDAKAKKFGSGFQLQSPIWINGEWVTVRYQYWPTTGTKKFGIVPSQAIITLDEAKNDSGFECYKKSVNSVLRHLEKNADWIFEKNGDGTYKVEYKTRNEFGLSPEVSKVITELMGDNFGIPGETDVWVDHSSDSMSGIGEAEVKDIAVAEGIYKSGDTRKRTLDLEKKISGIKDRQDEFDKRLRLLERGDSDE